MLWKKKYYLIIIIIVLINYILIYLSKKSQPFPKLNKDEGTGMHKLSQPADLDPSIKSPPGKRVSSGKNQPIAVLVMACNRPSVTRCIDSILNARPDETHFPIIVSQDCIHKETEKAIAAYKEVLHIKQPNQTDPFLEKKKMKLKGYFRISRHYKWALSQVFLHFNYSACIVVEDDLEVSQDFFEYFLATHPLLLTDSYLYCVSAWNDNGKDFLVDSTRPDLIHRTDFFPGLGWMLTKKLWLELNPLWPDGFWDDWLRDPVIRKNRSCLRPEISRTETFGLKGVSNGLHYSTHLKHIKKYSSFYKFTSANLSYLQLDNYEESFLRQVYASPIASVKDVIANKLPSTSNSFRVIYNGKVDFVGKAKLFKIMPDFKSGIPRTAYRGIVPFRYSQKQIYLSPIYDWAGYNTTWNN